MDKANYSNKDSIETKIWDEEPEEGNPFAAATCYCAGYDVYGDLLGNIRWVEYLFLMIKQEPPSSVQVELLEALAVILANPGPRDYSVRAAMSAAAGGSTSVSCLISALAVGAGQYSGAREVYRVMHIWQLCETDLCKWKDFIEKSYEFEKPEIWMQMEHPAGFDPYGISCATPVKQALTVLKNIYSLDALGWLFENRLRLEKLANCPLAMVGVAAIAFNDLGMTPEEGEMLYLLLRLPGAVAHALEQHMQWKRYPYFRDGLVLTDDPGVKANLLPK